MKYVRLHLDEHVSLMQTEREYGIRNTLVAEWVKRQLQDGEDALEPRIRYRQQKDYEVLEELRVKYPIDFLCKIMGSNRSGYCKWKARQRKLNRYEQDRILPTQLLQKGYKLYPSLGYHRLTRNIFHNTGWIFLDNLAHKCYMVSDMTMLKNKGKHWEWTLLLDTFNNEIIAHNVSPVAGNDNLTITVWTN